MGCFLACFGGPKDRKRRRPVVPASPAHRIHESYQPLKPSLSPKKLAPEVALGSPLNLRENQEPGSFSSNRKKVTFDLNVKTYEDVSVPEDSKYSSDEDVENEEKGEEKSSPVLCAFPANHRYQNCVNSDDEEELEECEGAEDEEFEDSDLDAEDEDIGVVGGNEDESYDSYFSLPMDKEREELQEISSPKSINETSPDKQLKILDSKNVRDRSQYIHSVLNPVENISQWKEVKVRVTPAKLQKENISFEPEPVMKVEKPSQKNSLMSPSPISSAKQEVSVDASLSTWLSSPESPIPERPQMSKSHQSNSSLSREDQPILGALTVDDLKQSVTSSPRRSPSKSPDEMPILGTVGSYWNDSISSLSSSAAKGIPNTTSKYREDRRVNWHSTPFEKRLDKALNNRGALETSLS
ncbi:uncharacterized protein LOC120275260 [Dioscorea cayenensis subsp. rotundata]|uniref:Uncharacterized protein LOC120275260 n=1 Tax=Dioscorea cayennensis subsp. rotundata TaxID=55577 RepID=A0AB40CG18_DIOCR|nr:uncharacterized protein LOC120275260 [Dioscorea cayenensis subsp. rotundata]